MEMIWTCSAHVVWGYLRCVFGVVLVSGSDPDAGVGIEGPTTTAHLFQNLGRGLALNGNPLVGRESMGSGFNGSGLSTAGGECGVGNHASGHHDCISFKSSGREFTSLGGLCVFAGDCAGWVGDVWGASERLGNGGRSTCGVGGFCWCYANGRN